MGNFGGECQTHRLTQWSISAANRSHQSSTLEVGSAHSSAYQLLLTIRPADFGCTAGRVHLFVSNNDDSIKVFQLPDMRRVEIIACPVAINYCSVNEGGSMLAAAGDSHSV